MAQVSTQGNRQVFIYDTQDLVAKKLADYIYDLYKKNIRAKDRFTVVLSGLAEAKALRTLAASNIIVDWSKWYVFFVDERAVPAHNPHSNYKVNYENFLSKVNIPRDQIYPINYVPNSPEGMAEDYTDVLNQAWSDRIIDLDDNGFPKFDLMLLGVGPDGHFASLFPNYPQLLDDTDWVTFLKNAPEAPHGRATMTLPVANCATNVVLLGLGSSQAWAVAKSIDGPGAYSIPTGRLQLEAAGDVAWFLDKEAASKLHPTN